MKLIRDWWLKITHDKLGWHRVREGDWGSGAVMFDGCNTHAVCWQCGSKVMRDSQGNWF